MSGPADGKYYIQLASSDRQPRIGVDYVEGLPVVPRVITDGRNNVWIVKKLGEPEPGGTPYLLVIELEGTGRPVYIHADDDGNLVGSNIPRSTWYIDGSAGGHYRIDSVGDFHAPPAWTVKDPEPKSPVTVEKTQQRNQKWDFIPHHGPE